jgi:outer membrane protein assembly factor BamB
MMKLRNKTKISTMALILMFAISALIVAVPSTIAQEAGTQVTYPFLGAVPNPVGKGQTVLFHVGIFQQLSLAQMGWEDMYITIEKPDGGTDTISDIKTDSTGGTGRTYTPEEVGVYYCTAHFPEQVLTETKTAPGIAVGTVMLESESAVLELVVQEDPIEYYPDHSLPSEYWARPIDSQLREWSRVTGSWLEATFTAPTTLSGNEDAPETAHILWRKALTMGGIADEAYYGWGFSHGDAYEGKWTNRIIIDGILIYLHRTNDSPLLYTAVDIHTGEELWCKTILDGATISFAQNLKWEGYNHHAVYPYFYVSTGGDWIAFDPYTGNQEFTVENVPSGTRVSDENGWLYIVNVNYNTGEGYVWSMVDLIEPFGANSPAPGSWLPAGSFYGNRRGVWDAAAEESEGVLTEEAQRAYIAEFTVDVDQCSGGSGAVRATAFGDKIFGLEYSRTEINTWAISLEEGNEGDILFSENWEAPQWWTDGQVQIEFNTVSLEDGAAAFWVKDTLQYYCFSTDTGEFMWGPSASEYYMNYYGWTEFGERPPLMWEGKLYSTGAGGIIYCYDLTDGTVLWDYASEDPYQEYLFANNWWQFFLWIVDGKLYTGHMEHSAIEPIPRGAPFMCLDATSGDLIWQADGLFRSTRWGGRGIMGDSIMVTMDTYDNNIYAVGKGQSALTVDKALAATEKGTAVTVQGTVMDVSPGTQDTLMQIRFPNGVPAVSDADMSEWMLYVYKNFERPAATGVTIKLEAVDPDGNYAPLGETTSDSYGNWAYEFCPEKVGKYMIIATFQGSGAYFGSTQTSYLTVVEPAAAPEPQQVDLSSLEEGQSTLTTYLLVVLVLVIIAIVLALYSVVANRK